MNALVKLNAQARDTRRKLLAATALGIALTSLAPSVPAALAAPDAITDQINQAVTANPEEVLAASGLTVKDLEALGNYAPAIVAALVTPDAAGNSADADIAATSKMLNDIALPAALKKVFAPLTREVAANTPVAAGTTTTVAKKGDYEIPQGAGKPRIQQFLYPTLAPGCQPKKKNSVATALITAGPQKAPAPGPKRGEAGVVFTALGTGAAVNNRKAPLRVSYFNLNTGKRGELIMKRNELINATKGPGTFTTIAHTGKGRVIFTIRGTVTTRIDGKLYSCGIIPTVGVASI